jgi:hypothetical protein
MKTTPGKAPGKKSLADLYDITEVTPATIAYAAVLVSHNIVLVRAYDPDRCFKCRHVLNAKESWCTHDGPFKSELFFKEIMRLFKGDNTWTTETLNWWNEYVLVILRNVCTY